MFGKVTTFAKHLHEEIISCYELTSKASSVWQTALGANVRRDLQFMTRTRKLSSVKRRLKTATVVVVLWPLLPKDNVAKLKYLIKEDP